MPIYEYICQQCQGRFQKLVSGFATPAGLQCPRCASADVRKAISRFAIAQSEESRLDALADPSTFSGLDENDPASVGRWAKKMGRQMGDELGEDWESLVDEMMEEEQGGDPSPAAGNDLGWD